MVLRRRTPALALALLLLAAPLFAQGVEYVRENYAKREFEIPMRDGVRLFTAVYAPKDASRKHPILLKRTPYGVFPYGEDSYPSTLGPSELFAKEGFIFVYQDVRGRQMSEGEFVHVRPHRPAKTGRDEIDESTDAYDTIEWLLSSLPNHNGRVGTWGISYPGFYASMGMIDAHPALVASSPQAPVADWFVGDDFHHNGALFLAHAFNFLANFERTPRNPTTRRGPRFDHGTPDGYRFFLDLGPLRNAETTHFRGEVPYWNEIARHPNYDSFWRERDVRPHLRGIRPAVLVVGGWFDAEDLFGALATYQAVEAQSPGADGRLVMGPWFHGGWARSDGESLGDVRFGSKTSIFYREEVELPFFLRHLMGGPDPGLPEALVFETGGNRWRREEAWPPKEARPVAFYFCEGGSLSRTPPAETEAYDEYASDPARPVPFVEEMTTGMPREYMTADQRFASRRPDVLVYETAPLEDDFVVAGPVVASLHVSSTGTDADFVVKLIDVHPNDFADPEPNPTRVRMGGYQQLVRGEPFRGRFRNGFDPPEPFRPGEVARIEFTMPDVCHSFRKGHRIMVQVQSTWFPLVDRNPQTFVDIFEAEERDFVKATHRVHRSASHPSFVRLNVLPAAASLPAATPAGGRKGE